MQPKDRSANVIIFVLLAVLCILTFATSLNNAFLIDDHDHILNNIRYQHPKFILYEFLPFLDPYQAAADHDYYRPLARLSSYPGYILFGTNVVAHHVLNLILFIGCCFSIYMLLFQLTHHRMLAFITSAFFAVHPLNSLCVNYITASVFSIQMMSMCWSMILYERRKYLLSYVFFITALLCHDTAMALPFLIMATTIFLRNKKVLWKKIILFLATIILILGWRFITQDTLSKDISFGTLTYFIGFNQIIAWYIQKLIFLDGVVLIWKAPTTSPEWVYSAIIVFIAVSLCIFILKLTHRNRFVTWALAWISIGCLMTAYGCLHTPEHGILIEPHWLFFPSIAAFALLTFLLLQLKDFTKPAFMAFVILVGLFFCIWHTIKINNLFKNEATYCQYWHNQTPALDTPLRYLIGHHMREQNYTKAKQLIEQLDPQSDITHLQWAYWHLAQNQFSLAKKRFTYILTQQPLAASVHYQLGVIAAIEDDLPLAEEYLQKSLTLDPLLLESRILLAKIHAALGRTESAFMLLGENLEIIPEHPPTIEILKTLRF